MKKALNWIAGLFRDERGNPSSKRFIGIIAGLTLCITMYVNSYTHGDIKPSDTLVNAVAMLALHLVGLGLASVDKDMG
jgi:hypothetical protein